MESEEKEHKKMSNIYILQVALSGAEKRKGRKSRIGRKIHESQQLTIARRFLPKISSQSWSHDCWAGRFESEMISAFDFGFPFLTHADRAGLRLP